MESFVVDLLALLSAIVTLAVGGPVLYTMVRRWYLRHVGRMAPKQHDARAILKAYVARYDESALDFQASDAATGASLEACLTRYLSSFDINEV